MIDSEHPFYTEKKGQWARCRDCYEGEDAVKERGVLYLPKLTKQKDASYDAYRKRASFYNGVQRTVLGLVGAVMRVPPVLDAFPEEWEKDLTLTGLGTKAFISYLLQEYLITGRVLILVDHDGTRPYLTGYSAEQATNWLEDRVILKEQYRAIDLNDPYTSSFKDRYRELVLEEGRYVVRLWQKNSEEKWTIVEEIVPGRRGKALEDLPLISVSETGNIEPGGVPLLSLADMNLSHYRTSADLEHGRHFTALPTPYVTGVDADSELSIGAESAWVLPDSASKAGYLEFTGQGLKALETAMEQKRSMMATLGAQLLEGQKNGVEAGETLRLRQNSEMSVLMGAVKGIEQGINRALAVMAEWAGTTMPSLTLNTDFADTRLAAEDMTALMQAWQSGAISHETFLWNMKRGEILEEGVSIEEERDRIEIQAPIEEL